MVRRGKLCVSIEFDADFEEEEKAPDSVIIDLGIYTARNQSKNWYSTMVNQEEQPSMEHDGKTRLTVCQSYKLTARTPI